MANMFTSRRRTGCKITRRVNFLIREGRGAAVPAPNEKVPWEVKVARYGFSGSTPPKCELKLRCNKQRFGKMATTGVLDKDEKLL